MKKIVLLLVLGIVAALPAIPYYIGTTVEESFRTTHEEAATDAALSGFDVELIDYQRGFLDATASTRITVSMPQDNKQEKLTFEMLHKISHLPQLDKQVIATVNSELILSDELTAELDKLFKGASPLVMKTRIFFDGHQEGTIHSPSARAQISDKTTLDIEWQGLDGTAWQSAERDRVTFSLFTPGISMRPLNNEPLANSDIDPAATAADTESSPNESITLKELRYGGEIHRAASGMWMGGGEGSLANFSINMTDKSGTPTSILINSVSLKADQKESSGLIGASGAFTANSINFNGFMLSNAVYDFAIENIDASAVVAWQKTAAKIMKAEIAPDKAFEPMAENIPALFNAHPVIKINDISVDSPLGRFALKMNTSINGEWDDMLLQNPIMVVPMLKIDLKANLPRMIVVSMLKDQLRGALLRQTAMSDTEMTAEELEATVNQSVEQQLGGMIAQGYIKEKAAQLESHLVFEAGQLTVNGIDASPMLGGMMR